jgi:hypothetical protein
MDHEPNASLTEEQIIALHRVSRGLSIMILNEHRDALIAMGLIVRGHGGALELSDLGKRYIDAEG